MTSCTLNHPDDARLQRQGWICSMAAHAIMGACALALVSGLRMPLETDQFKWNVALVEPPKPQPTVEPVADSKPKPTPPKPQVVKTQPPPPQRVIETVQQKVLQPVQAVPQVVERRMTRTVDTATRVTTVNQTASVVTQRVEQSERVTPVSAPTAQPIAQQEPLVATSQAIAQPTAKPLTTEAPVSRPATEPVVQRAAVESPGEVISQPQRTVHEAAPTVERTVTDTQSHPTTQPSSAPVEQAVSQVAAVRSMPATKADYSWLMNALLSRVNQLKHYPHMARMNHWEGKVVLRAVIRDDGQVLMVDVHESSGRSVLDNDAIETLRKASPLTLEHPLGKPQVAILMPISYSLR